MSWIWIALAALTLIGIALGWAYTRMRPHPQLASEFASQYKTVGDFHIHYIEAGSGPALILLHGIGASLYIWRFLMRLAVPHFRVIAIDLPGFGESSKNRAADYGLDAQTERLIQFLDQLGIQQAYLVGSSMGGAIALWMARTQPQRFPKVIVLAPAVHPRAPQLNLSLLRFFAVKAHLGVHPMFMRALLRRIIAKQDLITEDTIQRYLQPYIRNSDGIYTLLRATRILQDKRLPDELARVQVPCLILHGVQDQLVSSTMMQDLTKILPAVTLVSHPTAGHHSMEDEPDWVMAEILRFIRLKT